MKRSDQERYVELISRPTLSPGETAELDRLLRGSPDLAHAAPIDRALTRALAGLPAPPLSSNFTERAVAEAELALRLAERAHAKPRVAWLRFLFRPGWSVALIALTLTAGSLGLLRQQQLSKQLQWARNAATLPGLSGTVAFATQPGAASPAELLRDFDAIRKLAPGPAVDTELLSALR